MKETSMPSYAEINKILSKTALKLNPSQVHGVIAGVICGHAKAANWQQMVTGDQKSVEKTNALLTQLHAITAQELDEYLFNFQLLLPDDETPLVERAEALTLWCQGFLTGLKEANVKVEGRKPGEVTEAINDLIEIAKMDYEEVVASEEDEAAYVELVEYVRMAIILIYQELQAPAEATGRSSQHLH